MHSRSAFVVATVAALSGCDEAVIIGVASDRPVPQAIDAICVGVADVAGGGRFGRRYQLEGRLGSLPQTLRVEAGDAEEAYAWVRGDRAGVPVVRAGASVDFASDVTLGLDRCAPGAGGEPAQVGAAAGPADARLVASSGAGGDVVVALGATAAVLDARGGSLVATPAPELPPGAIVDLIAADVDGDCDDDLVLATDGSPPITWLRDGVAFTAGATLGDVAVSALAAADVDRDGDIDLITGDAGTLLLWRNDGSGAFAADPAALGGEGRVRSISGLALGDLDGDGNPDLVVGQAGDPLRAWLGEPGGTGSFLAADAVIAPIVAAVTRLQLADIDGDFDPDLVVAIAGGPLKIFVDREGLLEDQTFPRLGSVPAATAIAVGGWDLGCEPDVVIASLDGSETRRGLPGGALELDGSAPAAGDVVMVDLDDDGILDAVIATAEGARWLAR